MLLKSIILTCIIVILNFASESLIPVVHSEFNNKEKIRFLFYNVENLFDTIDDPQKNDDEFLLEGNRYWTLNKYHNKLNHLYKVIVAVGEWQPPALIGLCEIENRKVLYDLTQNTPLSKFDYAIIHHESPDERGIDVAFLYLKKYFIVLDEKAIKITFQDNTQKKTRDILYIKGMAMGKDTLHVFINHWPSRRGGQKQSENYRCEAAQKARQITDSLFKTNPAHKIILTGDFNDDPFDKSLKEGLNVQSPGNVIDDNRLYNLSSAPSGNQTGTIKYEGKWNVFDQFIVSGALLNKNQGIYTLPENFTIYSADFLLQSDEKYTGYRPLPTFYGLKYLGGFSDHLPVFIDLFR